MAKQTIFQKSRTVRTLYRMEQSESPSGGKLSTRVEAGKEEVYFLTEIDLAGLELLAQRAARNKSGKAVDGPLAVYVTERRRL